MAPTYSETLFSTIAVTTGLSIRQTLSRLASTDVHTLVVES
jgi:hypothetical protein